MTREFAIEAIDNPSEYDKWVSTDKDNLEHKFHRGHITAHKDEHNELITIKYEYPNGEKGEHYMPLHVAYRVNEILQMFNVVDPGSFERILLYEKVNP